MIKHNLAKELLPYKTYDSKNHIFINENSLGFCLEIVPIAGFDDSQIEYINSFFREFLKQNESIQTLFISSENKTEQIQRWLMNNNRNRVDPELMIRRSEHIKGLRGCFDYKIVISYTYPLTKGFDEYLLNKVIGRRDSIIKHFKSANLDVAIMDIKDFLEITREVVNGIHENRQANYNPYALLDEQIFTDDLKITEKNYINLDSKYHQVAIKTFKVVEYPNEWHQNLNINLLSGLKITIHCSYELMDIAKYKLIKKSKGDKVIKNAKTELGSKDLYGNRGANEWILADLEEQKGEVPLKNLYTITLYSSPKFIDHDIEQLKLFFRKQGFVIEANDPELDIFFFINTFPMLGHEEIANFFRRGMLRTTLSSEPAHLMPLQAEWKGNYKGNVLLVGEKGQIQAFTPFANQGGNYNISIVGKSGSGKSVFMQEIIMNFLTSGAKVYVLDIGRSYKKISDILKGEFVEFTPVDPKSINPFLGIKQLGADEAQDFISLLKPIIQLMSSPKTGTTDLEDSQLEEALVEVISKYKEKSSIDLIIGSLKHKNPQLAQKMFSFSSKGVYGSYFNDSGQAINLNSDFVVVEFEEIREKKELKQVVLQTVILQITKQALLGDRTQPFFIIIDEAWELLDDSKGALFIETLARRLRKYNGSLVCGTQSVNDFYKNDASLAAFQNSDYNIFLAQKPESIDQLKKDKRFNLTPFLERKLKSIKTVHGQYSELVIVGPDGVIPTKLILDDYSKQLYSTKAEDFVKFKQLLKQGNSADEAIRILSAS